MAMLYQISRTFYYRDKKVFSLFVDLYKQYVHCHLEYVSPTWSPWLQCDIDEVEKVQRRMVNMIPGLAGTYEEKLAAVGLSSLADRRTRTDMVQTFKIINGVDDVPMSNWFNLYDDGHRLTCTSNNPSNIIPARYNTDMRGNFFSNIVVRQWNSLPDAVKNCTTVSTFKKHDNHQTQVAAIE